MADLDWVLRSTPARLSVTFYGDETPLDADGAVTITITKADGSVLVSAAGTTHVTPADSGTYTFDLAPQVDLNVLTCVWTGTFSGSPVSITTGVEIIGGQLFTLAEGRASDSALSDVNKYPISALIDARVQVTEEFERACKRSFIPRYRREVVDGVDTNGRMLLLDKADPIRLLSVKVREDDDTVTTWTAPEIATLTLDRQGEVARNDGDVWPTYYDNNITVEYEYGLLRVPAEIKRVALIRFKSLLVQKFTAIPDRATSWTAEGGGTFSLATPGRSGYITGIPEVDAVLNDYYVVERGGAW